MTLAALRGKFDDTFASLRIRNYRLYFIGQGFTQIGDWMHIVALGWLVLQLTGSGTALGTLLALRFAPVLLGGLHAGRLVDTMDKRRILYVTQSSAAFLAFLLGILVVSGTVELWMIYVITLLYGVLETFDRPTRQTFVHEMVGPDNLRNAVALNSTIVNVARSLGPLFAGAIIATIGLPVCFFVNGFSYFVYLLLLMNLRAKDLHRETRGVSDDHLFAGLRFAASVPEIRTILLSMAVIGTLSYEFQVTLPLLAKVTFLGTAADYAALLSAMGIGSVAGGLFSASRKEIAVHEFLISAFLFGTAITATALAPTLGLAVVAMVAVGFFSITMASTGNTLLQLAAGAEMRGRIMALWGMAVFGSTLIGAPIIGFIGEHASARAALATGGAAAILTALVAGRRLLPFDRLLTIPAFIKIRREEATSEVPKA